jgi:hypothetical protein
MLIKESPLSDHSSGVRVEREPSALHKLKIREGEDPEIVVEIVVEAGGVSRAWQHRGSA